MNLADYFHICEIVGLVCLFSYAAVDRIKEQPQHGSGGSESFDCSHGSGPSLDDPTTGLELETIRTKRPERISNPNIAVEPNVEVPKEN